MIDYFRNHGDVKTLEEAKNNLRTAKNFWFAPDFIQYFEAVKAQNAQWYCTGKNRLAKTWDKAPVVFFCRLPAGGLYQPTGQGSSRHDQP